MKVGQAFMEDPRQTLERVGERRLRCGLLGVALVMLAAVAMLTPFRLFGSILKVVGGLLIGSAVLKATQLLPGRSRRQAVKRGWALILAETALDGTLGYVLLNHIDYSVTILATLLGLLFVADGLILVVIALRSPTACSRLALWLTGLITAGLGVFITVELDAASIHWAGFLVGVKLLLFGVALIWIALSASSPDSPLVFEAPAKVEPVPGELYAVYFGTAFHLGIFVGNDEVVHYTDANRVDRLSWTDFLRGRMPMHRQYPDLPPVSAEEVVRLAESRVGETSKYSLLRNNCEHFAIECKSGGATRYSQYAQIPESLENAAAFPWTGPAVELYTRVVEWLAFNLGGAFGKKVALEVRHVGALIGAWLLTRRLQNAPARPADACPDLFGSNPAEKSPETESNV